MTGRTRVGVSGWTYRSWRGDFYPPGLPQRAELAHLGERLDTVEVNGSFYSLQRPATYARWRDQVPPGFPLAVKGGRFVTHLRRLVDVEQGLANFWASGVLALEDRLGPVLWQLPADLALDPAVLDHFLALLPRTTAGVAEAARGHDDKVTADRALTRTDADRPVRHALEPRHPSFASDEAVALLRRHGVACVWSDGAGRWPVLDHDTADFRYVRLHGHTELYASGYRGDTLDAWARRCREWAAEQDVYVYFDNDARGRAPHDAVSLRHRVAG